MHPALPIAGGMAAAGAAAALAHAVFNPRSSAFCRTISRVPPQGGRIALTFDDGPWEGSTERVLDALAAAGITATFFVIGRNAQRWPDLVRRAHAEGHAIGNHTLDHDRAGLFRGPGYWRDQLARTSDLIERLTGDRPSLFRAPMGFKNPPLGRAAAGQGLRVVGWSVRARDGVTTTPARIAAAVRHAGAGDIVLMHDGRDAASRRDVRPTADALPGVLTDLASRGLRSERLDTLLGGVLRAPGSGPPA